MQRYTEIEFKSLIVVEEVYILVGIWDIPLEHIRVSKYPISCSAAEI